MTRRDITTLFATRIIRLFCYGFLSVILALYLVQAGLTEQQVGLLFTLTLAGDAGISLWLTTSADRFGRKRTLIIGAISPSGNEIGPFLSVEQASLSHLLPAEQRTQSFAWYNLAGSFATAVGALSGGWLAQDLQARGMPALDAYRVVLAGYALGGLVLAILFVALTRDIEVGPAAENESGPRVLGLHKSRGV